MREDLECLLDGSGFDAQDLPWLVRAIKQSGSGIALLRAPEFHVQAVNDGFTRITGYRRHEVVGESYRKFIPLSDRKRQEVLSDITAGRTGTALVEARKKHGRPYHAQFSFSPIMRNDTLWGVGAMLYDASDWVNAQRFRQVGRNASARVLHSLKNKLQAAGLIELVLEDEPLSREGKGDLRSVQQAVYSAQEDIKDLQRLASASESEFEIDHYALDDVVNEVVDGMGAVRAKYGVDVQRDLSSVRGWIDHDRYASAVRNVLDNALKFSSQGGGSVALGLERVERFGEPYGVLSVRDDGPGLTADQQLRVFEQDNGVVQEQDVDDDLKRISTGFGLYDSKLCLESLSGFIDVESTPGQGATFYLGVPAYR